MEKVDKYNDFYSKKYVFNFQRKVTLIAIEYSLIDNIGLIYLN